jgi:hypothetical protein
MASDCVKTGVVFILVCDSNYDVCGIKITHGIAPSTIIAFSFRQCSFVLVDVWVAALSSDRFFLLFSFTVTDYGRCIHPINRHYHLLSKRIRVAHGWKIRSVLIGLGSVPLEFPMHLGNLLRLERQAGIPGANLDQQILLLLLCVVITTITG